MSIDYYSKYIKYKQKYVELQKKQYGGSNFIKNIYNIPLLNWPVKRSYIEKNFNQISYFDTVNNIVYMSFTPDIVNEPSNFSNIDLNIFMLKLKDNILKDDKMTDNLWCYLTGILKNPEFSNNNLFISIAPVTLKEYYFPLFLEEYLIANHDQYVTVVIFGMNYRDYPGFSVKMEDINELYGNIKERFGNRVKIIHVYTNFYLQLVNTRIYHEPFVFTKNFLHFLSVNTRDDKLNVLYNGVDRCGFVKNFKGIETTDFILMGCDCLMYKDKQILLPEQNYDNMIISSEINKTIGDIIESNKIKLETLLSIKN